MHIQGHKKDDAGMTVKAIIFDYKTLLAGPGTVVAVQSRTLLQWLHEQGLRWCLFSTDPLSASQQAMLSGAGFPAPDEYIQKADIPSRKGRGSPDWIDVAARRLGIARNELLYVGCTVLDWRTAINSGVLYLHARWAGPMPPGTTSFTADAPSAVQEFLEFFLLRPPRWACRLEGITWTLRSLLPASAVLPSTSPSTTFRLQDVFTYERSIRIADDDARDLLMLYVLSNAYLEGLLEPHSFLCVYPGSRRGTVSEQLRGYLGRAASLVHGYYRDDLLVRASDAPDTSLARWRASQAGTTANVSIATQATTVHIGPGYRGKLSSKTVIVFDDFTTQGMSLEWARSLLGAAGARRVVLLTVGKYGTTHTHYELKQGRQVDPYAPNTSLTAADFTGVLQYPQVDPDASRYFCEVTSRLIAANRNN